MCPYSCENIRTKDETKYKSRSHHGFGIVFLALPVFETVVNIGGDRTVLGTDMVCAIFPHELTMVGCLGIILIGLRNSQGKLSHEN